MLELVGLGVLSYINGADLAWSDFSPHTGTDIHRSGFALGLIGVKVFLSLHVHWYVLSYTGADLAWSPYTGVDIHRSGLALECFLSQHCHGVFSLVILAWSSWS